VAGEPSLESTLFDDVADVVRGLVPPGLGPVHARARRYGIKVWFGAAGSPGKEHYEAQVVGAREVKGAKVLAVEIGFHCEYPRAGDNDAVLARLRAAEKRWRRQLGKEAVMGPFLGRQETWRRVSETWCDPDLSEPELAFEVGARLTDYISALEPVLTERANEQ
jgi:hypothetical protein